MSQFTKVLLASGVFALSSSSAPAQSGSDGPDPLAELDSSFSLTDVAMPLDQFAGDQDGGGGGGSLFDWPGFLTGMQGFESFVRPVSDFVYFEEPFINTDLRLIYAYHTIPSGSTLRGGTIHVVAAQIRLALTERLALIATKDGYSWISTGITKDMEGWNDFTVGLKYAFVVDQAEQFVLTGGLRWEWENGDRVALQGNDQELSPFISVAKAWDKIHFLGSLTGRIPTNHHSSNYSIVWDLHFDYELAPNFYPLVEFHGIHWLSNADRLPLDVEYVDVGNLGSNNVRGDDFYWAAIGFRWKITPKISWGTAWQFPLQNPSKNVFDQRVTVNVSLAL